MSAQPRVLVADASPIMTRGLRRVLERDGMQVVAEAHHADTALAAARAHEPDVCLVDVGLPGGGVELAGEIVASVAGALVIMLGECPKAEDLFDALGAGAFGYLLKDGEPGALSQAVRAALDGEAALPRALTARLIREYQRRDAGRQARDANGTAVRLSARGAEIIELMRRDLSTQEIAQRLGISPVTVRRHVSEAARLLQASDRADVLRLTATS